MCSSAAFLEFSRFCLLSAFFLKWKRYEKQRTSTRIPRVRRVFRLKIKPNHYSFWEIKDPCVPKPTAHGDFEFQWTLPSSRLVGCQPCRHNSFHFDGWALRAARSRLCARHYRSCFAFYELLLSYVVSAVCRRVGECGEPETGETDTEVGLHSF